MSEGDVPSIADVDEARRRLRRYAFVGITEHWDLSICLLHAMFGGDCHPTEFENVRDFSQNTKRYDTSILNGFVDRFDGALYDEAWAIFSENLRRYDISLASCSSC